MPPNDASTTFATKIISSQHKYEAERIVNSIDNTPKKRTKICLLTIHPPTDERIDKYEQVNKETDVMKTKGETK